MTKCIYTLFIFTLIFAPLAFGTVEPWSLTVMESCSLLALLLLLLDKVKSKEHFMYEIPGAIPLFCLLGLIGMQLIPLPGSIIRIISPATYDIYKNTIFLYEPMQWVSLSINKKATLMEFFRITSYIVFYILTIQILSRNDALKKTVTIVTIFASLLCLFAIVQHLLPNSRIYWIRELTLRGSPFGPYVNRNHFAGLMEMLFPVVLSLFLFYKPRSAYKSLRDRTAEIFTLHGTNVHILLGFSAVLIATSIFLTLSRSGIVSLCMSMIFFGLFFFRRSASKKRGLIIILIFVLIVLSVGWFGWDPIFERFERLKDAQGNISELRLSVWKDSRNIIGDFPLMGTGFGSFLNIYPKYRTLPGGGVAEHAHNDYIELLSEGGVFAFFFGISFLIVLFVKSYRIFQTRRELYSTNLYIASITGMISILIHGVTDFNLHIGANGLYFFFLAGLAVSSANTRLRSELNGTYLKEKRIPLKGLTAILMGVLLWCFIFQGGITVGKMYYSSIRDTKLNEMTPHRELVLIRDAALKASFLDPLEAQYRYASANIKRLLGNDSVLGGYKEAVRLNPVNGEYLERLGLSMSEFGKESLADKLLQAGITYDVSNPARYRRYALWLFAMGRKEEGISIARSAISLEPKKTKEYITLMVLDGFSDEEILVTLPERVDPHLEFADYLSKTGKDGMAEEEYLRALQYIKNEFPVKPDFFYAGYHYYLRKNRLEDALNFMQKAADALPGDPGIKMHIADLYEKRSLPGSAMAEYRKILALDPRNQEAKNRLDKLLLKAGAL